MWKKQFVIFRNTDLTYYENWANDFSSSRKWKNYMDVAVQSYEES